jgi:VanZ family protein
VAFGEEQLPLQRRDRPGFAPDSLTACRFEASLSWPFVAFPRALSLWLPVVAWAGLIFALSSIPDLGTGLGTWDLVLRKLAHAAEFAVLGLLLLRAIGREAAALAVGIAYAASDELHQHFVPGRQGSLLDVALDSVGVAVGVYAVRKLLRLRLQSGA